VYETPHGDSWIKGFAEPGICFASLTALQPGGVTSYSAYAELPSTVACIDMQAIEELAELITAINHFMRHKPDALDSLVEEIADVRIMTEQLALIVGEGKVQATEQCKLQKLYELLQTT